MTMVSSTSAPCYASTSRLCFLTSCYDWGHRSTPCRSTYYRGGRHPGLAGCSHRHKEDTGLRVMPARIRRVIADNRLFAAILVPALLIRVDAELGYRWWVYFNDSFGYISSAATGVTDPVRVSGYATLPVRAAAPAQPRAGHDPAARDGPAGRRHDLRARQEAVRRAPVARHGHDAPRPLRRVRDPARAPDPVGHDVPVRRDGGRDGAAVETTAVVVAVRPRRAAHRGIRHRAVHRPAAHPCLRRVPGHRAVPAAPKLAGRGLAGTAPAGGGPGRVRDRDRRAGAGL